MKTYQNQIDIFSKEIAKDLIQRETNPKWEIMNKFSIAQSISTIYEEDLRKVTEDLETEIKKSLKTLRSSSNYKRSNHND
jgi:hypothetical protein